VGCEPADLDEAEREATRARRIELYSRDRTRVDAEQLLAIGEPHIPERQLAMEGRARSTAQRGCQPARELPVLEARLHAEGLEVRIQRQRRHAHRGQSERRFDSANGVGSPSRVRWLPVGRPQ
jgi:hypothetical protein